MRDGSRELERPEINYVAVSGRITRRRDLSRTSRGSYMLVFFLENRMSDMRSGDPGTGDPVTNILRVICWGRRAQDLGDQLHAGQEVLVEGYLSALAYEDRQKAMHHRMELTAVRVQLLGESRED